MIVPMQRVILLATSAGHNRALRELQRLGVVHLDINPGDAPDLRAAEKAVEEGEAALRLLKAAPATPLEGVAPSTPHSVTPAASLEGVALSTPQPAAPTLDSILALSAELEQLSGTITEYDAIVREIGPFGEFDPVAAARLNAAGVAVQLFRAPTTVTLDPGEGYIKVVAHEHHNVVAVAFGAVTLPEGTLPIPLPEEPLSATIRRRQAACERQRAINTTLSACKAHLPALEAELDQRRELRDFAAAQAGSGRAEGLVWLSGFCPAAKIDRLRQAAAKAGWGFVAREPLPEEEPPTLLDPPAIARPMTLLFKVLGILPGYRESDISLIFYAFFTLFFAMLVGDAGYGAVILITTLLIRSRTRSKTANSAVANDAFTLLSVFAGATIIWGVLSGTYFGVSGELLPPLLHHSVAAWLGDQSNIMFFCFLLGALHLSLARLSNALALFPSKKALAELGWIGIIWTMFATACSVSVENFVFPGFMLPLGGISVLLVALFMLERSELKTNGVDLGMLPLNIISCLGDIISYVRLFAVGMASVKVAENFNAMALGMTLPLLAKIPIVILILLAGHGLNLLMGALSILVHAVRLNTLEFSNHKGITWGGFAYNPFSYHNPHQE